MTALIKTGNPIFLASLSRLEKMNKALLITIHKFMFHHGNLGQLEQVPRS